MRNPPGPMPPELLDIYRSFNAQAESLIGLYKLECVRPDGRWRTVEDLELSTLSWVHWFNSNRLHSALDNVPPVEYEQQHYRSISAAQ